MPRAPSAWSPSGFYGAPVTKAACITVIASHVAGLNFPSFFGNIGDVSLLSLTNLYHEPWKILLGTCTFATLGEVLWSLPILYTFRDLERRMGSNRFSSFVILSTVTVLATQIGLMHVYSSHDLASGPYGSIFGLFVFYFALIPKLSPQSLSLLGMHFSDKSFTYMLGIQLAMNGWSRGRTFGSLMSAVTGLCFGLVYMAEVFPLHNFRLPSSLVSLVGKSVLPWFGSSSPWESRIRRERERQERQQRGQQGRMRRNLTPAQLQRHQEQIQAAQNASMQDQMPVVEPSQENITQLVSMGFTEERAREALRSTQNNVEAAVGRLIG